MSEFCFPGLDPSERPQFFFRKHWIRLFSPFLRLLASNVVAGIVALTLLTTGVIENSLLRHLTLLLLSAFFLIAHFAFLLRFYRHFLTVILVTDRKLHRIKKTLFSTDERESVNLALLQNVYKMQHSIVQNMFGFGSLLLELSSGVVKVHFTPKISEKYQELLQLHDRAVRETMPQQSANSPSPSMAELAMNGAKDM